MIKKPYKDPIMKKTMAEDTIGGRPVDITKEDGKIKVVFHPLTKDAKHPKANVFTTKLSKSDVEKLKKAF